MNASATRFSAPDWCFFREGTDPAAYYRQLRALGITGVEMVDPVRRAAARAAGLEILNIAGPGMEVGLNRREHHADLVPRIEAVIDEAAAEGIPQVIVFSGSRGGQADGEGIANCVTALKPLAWRAEAAGVTLAFEMLNSHDHRDYQGDRSGYGFAVVDAVGSSAVRVLYDCYHMARMGEDLERDIAARVDAICHMHVANPPDRSAPRDDGTIDWRVLRARAQQAGYRGYWGLEFLPRGDVMAQIATAVTAMSDAAKAPASTSA
ncbi:MAG: TIM barrel protein [Planctomycetes bacterium]|nr:TIM barrel protein [Planctomycetota bacterium]